MDGWNKIIDLGRLMQLVGVEYIIVSAVFHCVGVGDKLRRIVDDAHALVMTPAQDISTSPHCDEKSRGVTSMWRPF